MIKILRDQRGYMLLNVIFLTVITSFAAMILLNAVPRARNPEATLRMTAIYLANEQFAELERRAAAGETLSGSYSFPTEYADDLTSYNLGADNPVEFTVDTNVSGNPPTAKVIVKWQFGGKDFQIKLERTIFVAD